ncbi:hypothetical protein LEP1GSC086_4159 [Leptospira weilii str. LNT 1234]|nr:hypothetical protein LEP1GSC086_4159 [Leptospira weilii str. LNT 1234]
MIGIGTLSKDKVFLEQILNSFNFYNDFKMFRSWKKIDQRHVRKPIVPVQDQRKISRKSCMITT